MATLASGVTTKIAYAKESTFNVKPAAGTARYIRRVTAELNLNRSMYESKELRTDSQTADARLGIRSVSGKLDSELSTNTFSDFFGSLLRGVWAVGATSGVQTTISFTASTIVRTTGSWLTDGFKVGMQVSATGASPAANNVPHIVTNVTALVLTVDAVAAPLVVAAAGPSITVAMNGKRLSIPQTGQTDESYTWEKFYDLAATDVVETFTGVKIADAAIKVGIDAMSSVSFTLMGAGFETSSTPYFTSPTPAGTNSVLSGAKGALYLNGVQSALITAMDFDIKGNYENATTIFTTNIADIMPGRIGVSGNISLYFKDNTMLQDMNNEVEQTLVITLYGNGTESLIVTLPRVKLGEVTKDDKETGALVQSVKFTALLPLAGTTLFEQSTIIIQDTTLV